MKLGYARVSTLGQSLEVQQDKLNASGCERIFQEKKSGKTTDDRDELKKLLDGVLRAGDTLVVTKLDRLGRSVLDLCNITKQIEALGATLVVLGDNIDTSTPHGRLFFHILASIGEFERSVILQRTEEGRLKAKAEGVKFGPKDKLTDLQKTLLRQEFKTWTGSKKELADRYGISVPSLYRIAKQGLEGGPATISAPVVTE